MMTNLKNSPKLIENEVLEIFQKCDSFVSIWSRTKCIKCLTECDHTNQIKQDNVSFVSNNTEQVISKHYSEDS